jgi:hypothetical protein
VRVARITVWAVDLALAEPYRLSGGRLKFDRMDLELGMR